jgi:hypothetical protein
MATDLKAFQARLNSDKAVRGAFFKDPVKTLEAEGLILPDEAKKRLIDLVNELRTKKRKEPGDGEQIRIIIVPEDDEP